jgi:hypothetical protein
MQFDRAVVLDGVLERLTAAPTGRLAMRAG